MDQPSKETYQELRIARAEIKMLEAKVDFLQVKLHAADERHSNTVMRLQHADWVLKEGAYIGDADECRCCKNTKDPK